MKILAIGAHFDDWELGCGGSLLRWRARGEPVTLFVASTSGYRTPSGEVVRDDEVALAEGAAAAQRLGAELHQGGVPTFEVEFGETLNARLLAVVEKTAPELVLTHWSGDVHHDHRALALASLHVCRHVPRILAYRSNWYPGAAGFEPRYFVDIEAQLDDKLGLVRLHASEHGRTAGRWEEALRAQARELGERAGCRYAEGFEVIRWLE